jgi:hypothetical protein
MHKYARVAPLNLMHVRFLIFAPGTRGLNLEKWIILITVWKMESGRPREGPIHPRVGGPLYLPWGDQP